VSNQNVFKMPLDRKETDLYVFKSFKKMERRAEQLRKNLLKRKEQARARKQTRHKSTLDKYIE
tara:strand:- start:2921 stop:3109 length:189 start_codon:yes stop_codon:yes gene_type:complete